MTGFLGDSDRPGFRRLYFTRDLDYYAEFRVEDVVDLESIPADQPPFRGEEATRLALRRDATLEYTRVRTARPLDEFDADVQLVRRRAAYDKRGRADDTWDTRCPSECETWCHIATCDGTCPNENTCPDTCSPPCPEVPKAPYPSYYGEIPC
jgi:hypothetical protein